jgi:Xaa-Pro aminopeptidase
VIAFVPDVLIHADTIRAAELRHEVPVAIPDPFLYAERNGVRHVVISSLELPRLDGLGLEIHPLEEYGIDELRRSGLGPREVMEEIALRGVAALGVGRAVVPDGFPLRLADRLRAAGVELLADGPFFDRRRRVKNGRELAGIRRAQSAAEAGMTAARELLRRARRNGGSVLRVDGAPLTSERVKLAIVQAFLEHGASADELIVSHGPQAAIGHHAGSGEIHEGETIVIDIWPRDNESSCSADMTRTFVVGEVPPEVREWHSLCLDALERAVAAARPGVTGRDVFEQTCELFEAAGFPTQRTKRPGETLADGFFHSLGHGVGLEVHEQPLLGLSGHDELLRGEVVAVEPGLYRSGFGGCRLEDLLLVAEGGAENLTSFPYDLEP